MAYLTYIIDPINEEMELTKILILKGCPDFFPMELPRLPPDSEVEVSIDVILRTISIGVDAFTNESHKTKSFDDIDQDKKVALKARIKAIKEVDLYDLIQVMEMCLVPNMVVPKTLYVPLIIKYISTQYPITHLKSYCNKIAKVVRDEKLWMHLIQDSLSGAALS
jgi:hypothetical protein